MRGITLCEGWHDRCCAFPQGYAKSQLAKGKAKPTAKTGKNFQRGAWHSCLSAKLAKSTSRLFCGVCVLAWEMLCISVRCTLTALCKRQGKNCTESGNLCRVFFAYRKKLPFRYGVAFAGFASWHGRCCAISLRKCLKLHLANALATLGTPLAEYPVQ